MLTAAQFLMRLCFLVFFFVGISYADDVQKNQHSPQEIVKKLMAGNKRFSTDHSKHPGLDLKTRYRLAKGQHPIAAILSCSDSRVPPEIIFDQGPGDLFVVRDAGNTVAPLEQGSLEYAVEHLGVHLIVVLGHERCGAVTASLGDRKNLHGDLKVVVDNIGPPLPEKSCPAKGDPLQCAVLGNVKSVVGKLKNDPDFKPLVKKGELDIIGGVFDLDTGLVTLTEQ